MSIELVRRLLGSGAPTDCVDAALSAAVEGNEPFVAVMVDRFPELAGLVERELARSGSAEIHVVRASTELSSRLPAGMCERLLAVPVLRDPETGRVDVAAVDVHDPHVAAEFGYQLGTKIRVLRASLPAVRAALSALGVYPPIPLVRPSGSVSRAEPVEAKPTEEVALNLTRSKHSSTATFAFARPLASAASDLESASSPDALASALVSALEPAFALVLAVKRSSFEARAASRALGPELPAYSVAADKSSVFDIAVRSGHYLGCLPGTLVHAELRALLGGSVSEEVYVAPVLVSGRAVLVLLIARMGPTFEATRRADELVRSAGDALSRIVRARKQR